MRDFIVERGRIAKIMIAQCEREREQDAQSIARIDAGLRHFDCSDEGSFRDVTAAYRAELMADLALHDQSIEFWSRDLCAGSNRS